MLRQPDPAAGDLLVERAVLGEFREFALLVLVFLAVPRRAIQAERLRIGETGFDHRRHPIQATLDIPRPGRRAGIHQGILHLHGVAAAGQGDGALQLHAGRGGGHEAHLHARNAAGQHDITRRAFRLRNQRAAIGIAPERFRREVGGRCGIQQHHRRAAGRLRPRIGQQGGVRDAVAIQLQRQHVVAQLHGGGRGRHRLPGGRRCRGRAGLGHRDTGTVVRPGGWHRGWRRGRRRVHGCVFLAPFLPQQEGHHQPGDQQESTDLVHGLGVSGGAGRAAAVMVGDAAGGIVPAAAGRGNAPARTSKCSKAACRAWVSARAASWRATTT